MAESVIGTGTLPDGGNFQIYLDGISTYKQSERMISKLDALVKRFKATEQQNSKDKKEREEEHDLLKDKNKKTKDLNKNFEDLKDSTLSLHDAHYILRGDLFGLAQAGVSTSKSIIGLGIAVGGFNTMIGALTQYSAQLGQAMQRGVAGDVMTFAIASKSAGLTLGQFNKALSESGGSFALLGSNATEGAKNFGNLIARVRAATQSMGNFGLTNEEMANFVAQQTKFAIAQGFKGRKAEEVVLKNTVQLGEGFQDLAERTGRTVKEMADAAAKLSMDPVVASFVKSAGAAGPEVSAAIAKLAGDFAGIFGEAGNKIAEDLTKTGLGNLPFVMTQSGKNMMLASNSVYTEMERQANMARNGIKTTEADQERLRQVVQQEVAMRGDELRTLANLQGPMGDAARQILQLAANAEQMNSAETKEAKRRSDNAKAFAGAVNDLQAKLQELAIPFLQLINGIDWTFMFSVLSSFASTVKFLLTPLEWLGSLLGASGAGTVIGGMLALVGVVSMGVLAFSGLTKALGFATTSLKNFGSGLVTKARDISFGPTGRRDYRTLRRAGYDRQEAADMIRSERQAKYTGRAKEVLPFAAIAAGGAVVGMGLSALGEKLKESNNELGEFVAGLGSVAQVIGTWGAILAPIITSLFPGLAAGAAALLLPLAKFAIAAGLIVGGLWLLWQGVKLVGDGFVWLWDSIKSVGTSIANGISTIWETITKPFTMLWNWLKNSFIGKMLGQSSNAQDKNQYSASVKQKSMQELAMDEAKKFGRNTPNLQDKQAAQMMYKKQQLDAAGRTEGVFVGGKLQPATPTDQTVIGGGKSVMKSQTTAVEAADRRASEEKNNNQKMVGLLEDIKTSNEAGVGVQAKGVAIADNSNKYLRNQTLYSGQ